jgi:hypothetical protein
VRFVKVGEQHQDEANRGQGRGRTFVWGEQPHPQQQHQQRQQQQWKALFSPRGLLVAGPLAGVVGWRHARGFSAARGGGPGWLAASRECGAGESVEETVGRAAGRGLGHPLGPSTLLSGEWVRSPLWRGRRRCDATRPPLNACAARPRLRHMQGCSPARLNRGCGAPVSRGWWGVGRNAASPAAPVSADCSPCVPAAWLVDNSKTCPYFILQRPGGSSLQTSSGFQRSTFSSGDVAPRGRAVEMARFW